MAREEDLENEEEEEITSASEKNRLLKIMSKLNPGKSEEERTYYDWLSERVATLSEAERNEKQTEQIDNAKWSWILPTVIQGASAIANTTISVLASRRSVRDITRYEDDGNIVKTAATGFINKPR